VYKSVNKRYTDIFVGTYVGICVYLHNSLYEYICKYVIVITYYPYHFTVPKHFYVRSKHDKLTLHIELYSTQASFNDSILATEKLSELMTDNFSIIYFFDHTMPLQTLRSRVRLSGLF
jgi:hypothetical protein